MPHCAGEGCNGLVKPDIVFFGEALPQVFRDRQHYPSRADLALVMGTSLTVHPFAGLPSLVRPETPRVLFNLEQVGNMGSRPDDVLVLGSCDASIRKLADELGWRDELESKWRSVVGRKEAERQLSVSDQTRPPVEQEGLDRLTDLLGEALQIRDDAEPDPEEAVVRPQAGQEVAPEDKEVKDEKTVSAGEETAAEPLGVANAENTDTKTIDKTVTSDREVKEGEGHPQGSREESKAQEGSFSTNQKFGEPAL